MLRARTPSALLEGSLDLNLPGSPAPRSPQPSFAFPPVATTYDSQPGEWNRGDISGQLDGEMSLALCLATPLALLGASLLAHGYVLKNDACTSLGGLALLSVAVVHARARHRVKRLILERCQECGLSASEGRRSAQQYLKNWFR